MINFNKIVLVTSLAIAICAASFSIYGIGLLFSGAAVAAMIMAGALEIGKLVTTSWLFKNWKITNFLMKTYMIIATVVLMGITSLGVFGYLTSAYQKSSLEHDLRTTKIESYTVQKSDEVKKMEALKKEIDTLYELRRDQESRLTDMLDNPLITRNPIQLQTMQGQITSQIESINNTISTNSFKIEQSTLKMTELDEDIIELKLQNSEQKDITTFKFVADEFGAQMNTVVKWFIFVIIAVFDPLAVVLLIAANMSLGNFDDKKDVKKKINNNDVNDNDTVKPDTIEIQHTGDIGGPESPSFKLEIDSPIISNKNSDILYFTPHTEVTNSLELENKITIPKELPITASVSNYTTSSQNVIVKEIEKFVDRPIEVVKEVEKIIEKPIIVKKGQGTRNMFSF